MSSIPPKSVPLLEEPAWSDLPSGKGTALSLPFTDEACKSALLVGGKGAQLAMLTAIQNEVNVSYTYCVINSLKQVL